MRKRLERIIWTLRRERMLLRDAIDSAVSELGDNHLVAKKLVAALHPGSLESIPCIVCNRMLKSKASIQRGMGASCRKKQLTGAVINSLPFGGKNV